MAGAVPSVIAALRDMLRHLDDADRLQQNPLALKILAANANAASSACAIAVRIRGVVAEALQSLLPPPDDRGHKMHRLYAIVARCDLGGELHLSVAHDLGLCKAQFYRERTKALELLAKAIAASLESPASTVTNDHSDDVRLRLSIAHHLESTGRFDDARNALELLIGQSVSPAQRTLAVFRLVDVLCQTRRFCEARIVLCRARDEVRSLDESSTDYRTAVAEICGADGMLAMETGNIAAAIENGERALTLLRTLETSISPSTRALFIELSILLGRAYCDAGEFERAVPVVELARGWIDASIPAELAVSLHFGGLWAYFPLPWGVSKALQENATALRLARCNGLIRSEGTALGNLCAIQFVRGEYAEALSSGYSAQIVIEALGTPRDTAMVQLNLARSEIALARYARALDLLARAKTLAAAYAPEIALIEVAEAEALTLDGRLEAAVRTAERARQAFEHYGIRKRIGIALRAQAEAYAKLGKQRAAVATIRQAVDATEAAGTAYSLADVYRTSASITGNKRHAGYAADIRSALRS
jgi:tetratricopeptide (TPR) repeat protein